MKRIIAFLLVLVMTVCLFSACNTEKEPDPPKDPEEQPVVKEYGKIFYVAVDGDDANAGTKESPLATLGGAVAKVREYKAANGLPEGGIKIEFAAGTYKVTQQTDLTEEDSGEEGKEIVYAAADGAEVIFDGGISLNASDFKPVNDEFKALLQTDEAKANVLEIDLAAAGIWDADDSAVYTANWRAGKYRQSLYVNNELQTVARWPNDENYEVVFADDANSGRAILFPEEKAALWANETNIRAYGCPEFEWSAFHFMNLSLNPGTSELPVNQTFNKGMPIFVFNIACELDSPGEYYWDVDSNKLYYWPENGFETAKISFSQLAGSVVGITETDRLTFEGFTFENLRYNAVSSEYSQNSDHITVSNCIFRCAAYYPVYLVGSHNTVKDNEFYDLGGGGVYVSGGDIPNQIYARTVVTNNRFHDWSQVYTVYNAAVTADGFGFVISHNEMYNSPHEAIAFNSGFTVIEYNHIYNVCTETEDAGAIYAGRRWDWGNSEVRYNYIHDINTIAGGIYLDDQIAKIKCYGNIIVNVGGPAFCLGGGKHLEVYNNIMVRSGNIYLDGRGYGWYPTVTSYPEGLLWKWNVKENYLSLRWKYMQPEYLSVLEMRTTEELEDLKGITSDILDSPGPQSYAAFYNNIVYYGDYKPPVGKAVDIIDNSAYALAHIESYTEYTDGLNDVFVDPANGNFFLKEDSRVYRDIIGFEKWDYSLIGIQK